MYPNIYREAGYEGANELNQTLLNTAQRNINVLMDMMKQEDFAIVLCLAYQYKNKTMLEYKTVVVWPSTPKAAGFYRYDESNTVCCTGGDGMFSLRVDTSGGFCQYDGEFVETTLNAGRFLAQADIVTRDGEKLADEYREALQGLTDAVAVAFAEWLTKPGRDDFLYVVNNEG